MHESEFTFTITGTVTAESEAEARERVAKMLRVAGFGHVGDGTLWLERPPSRFDDAGMTLGEMTVDAEDVEIVGRPGASVPKPGT